MAASDYLFEKTWQVLSKKERKAFDGWLKGTLGKNKPDLQVMFTRWQAGDTWECIAEHLGYVPGTNAANKRLSRLRSDLQEQLELYLSWVVFQQDNALQNRLVLAELVRRDAASLFPTILKKYQNARESAELRDQVYYEGAYWEETTQQGFWVKHPPNFRRGEHLVDTRMAHWLHWKEFDVLALGLAAEKIEAPERETTRRLAELFYRLSDDAPDTLQIVRDIHRLYQQEAWKRDTPKQDQELVQQFKALRPQFRIEEFTNLLMHVLNYLLRKAKYLSNLSPHWDAMAFCRWSLDERILPMNRAVYRTVANLMGNIILLSDTQTEAVALGEEAFEFLETYIDHLPDSEREKAKTYNRAVINFALGNYADLEIDLTDNSFKDPYYESGYELILLKEDIETGRLTGIREEIHRLKLKIGRAKGASDPIKQGHLNHLDLLRELISVKGRAAAEQLLERVKATQPLEGRVWLHKKVKALFE